MPVTYSTSSFAKIVIQTAIFSSRLNENSFPARVPA
jgi:hypothetical protein